MSKKPTDKEVDEFMRQFFIPPPGSMSIEEQIEEIDSKLKGKLRHKHWCISKKLVGAYKCNCGKSDAINSISAYTFAVKQISNNKKEEV